MIFLATSSNIIIVHSILNYIKETYSNKPFDLVLHLITAVTKVREVSAQIIYTFAMMSLV